MGSCTSQKQKKETGREKIFKQKVVALIEQFAEVKTEIFKVLDMFHKKFKINSPLSAHLNKPKTAIKKDSINSDQLAEIAMTSNLNNNNNNNNNNLINHGLIDNFGFTQAEPTTKERSKNPTLVMIEEVTAPTHTAVLSVPTINIQDAATTTSTSTPVNYDELVSVEPYTLEIAKSEFEFLRAYFAENVKTPQQTQRLNEFCRFFNQKFDDQSTAIEEFLKQADILNKCLRAFKEEIPSQEDSDSIFRYLSILINNAKLLQKGLKISKHHLASLSLMTIVKDTSSSVVSAESQINQN